MGTILFGLIKKMTLMLMDSRFYDEIKIPGARNQIPNKYTISKL
jgi:hypothetical protein